MSGMTLQTPKDVTAVNFPSLKDGYYEVESIRQKRIRKGKVEYLVKWLVSEKQRKLNCTQGDGRSLGSTKHANDQRFANASEEDTLQDLSKLATEKHKKMKGKHGDANSRGRSKHAKDDRSGNASEDNVNAFERRKLLPKGKLWGMKVVYKQDDNVAEGDNGRNSAASMPRCSEG